MALQITQSDPRDADARALLAQSHALMEALYQPEENHFLSVDALAGPDVRFFTARDEGGAALGCGALALRDGYGEVKSMYVAEDARGRGVAAAILSRIEDEASSLGLPLLRLETGDLLDAAHRLYGRHGFEVRGPFADYSDSPASIFMEKALPAR
ncbi:GNAT family N-acetyltransferase [Pseudaestuariivita atlantica]|uniref:Acetyltransferase n=1 Tax=Pseudaestuariivita atlantica TaxID=1317121 RepID=A0A0L1JSM4_9RHOB|nr:GNAT family N-acetyltransferase [Pseudaestuariivita atlantica]KNG94746.1 acetyltransferase [Pseudaestuariivita atlantica]